MMNERQEKLNAHATGAAYAFSLPVLVFSLGWMIYTIFEVDNHVLSAVFTFLGDSSGFLTFLCVAIILAALLRGQKQYNLVILNVVNVVLLNQLYLNSRWQVLFGSLRNFFVKLNWSNVFFFGAMLAVVGYCVYIGLKQRWKTWGQRSSMNSQELSQTLDDTASDEQSAAPQDLDSCERLADPALGQASGPQSAPPSGPNSPVQPDSLDQNKCTDTVSAGSVLLIACLAVPIVFIGKILVFDVWKLAPLSESLGVITDTLPILSVLAIGVILAPIIYKMFHSIGKTFQPDSIRITAFLALLLELGFILAVVLNGGDHLPEFLDKFLNSIVNNSLIALPLILAVVFIILDIVISIIMKIAFGKSSHEWIAKMQERIVLIEQGLTLFVCNLMIGFINLLLFIPDFFNHIGQLLLEEKDFFPQEKIEISDLSGGKKWVPPAGGVPSGSEKETTDGQKKR